ncbi:MAG TPA: ribose-5-phosphate isomerase RpiA, partial [Sphingomonas sp.]|nr:ribose-5-phosphate isomerase RpiA [Sphingomonas sp.]
MIDQDKRSAAAVAVAEIADSMVVGLGTGSTAAHAIRLIGARVAQGLTIRAVATSVASEALARSLGIIVEDFAGVARIDLAIDGADEIDEGCWAIKGAGGAMLREKVVAAAADRMIVIADGTKRVARIGAVPVPVEVLPFARDFVVARLTALGADVTIRPKTLSDNGNPIADCRFAVLNDPPATASAIDGIPGALGHGLFLTEVDAA